MENHSIVMSSSQEQEEIQCMYYQQTLLDTGRQDEIHFTVFKSVNDTKEYFVFKTHPRNREFGASSRIQ